MHIIKYSLEIRLNCGKGSKPNIHKHSHKQQEHRKLDLMNQSHDAHSLLLNVWFMFLSFPPKMLLPKGPKQHDLDSKTSQLSFSFSSAGAICLWVCMALYVLLLLCGCMPQLPMFLVRPLPKKRDMGSMHWWSVDNICYIFYFCLTTKNFCISYIKNALKQSLSDGFGNFQGRQKFRYMESYNQISCIHSIAHSRTQKGQSTGWTTTLSQLYISCLFLNSNITPLYWPLAWYSLLQTARPSGQQL